MSPRSPRKLAAALVNTWAPTDGARDGAAWVAADAPRRALSQALAARGHAITVIQESTFDERYWDGAVRWELHRSGRVARAMGDPHPMVRAPTPVAALRAATGRFNVVHSFDVAFPLSLAGLALAAGLRGAALVAHLHGGQPARRWPLAAVHRAALGRVRAVCVTDPARAGDWAPAPVVSVLETSTTMRPVPRDAARAALAARLRLDPAAAWVVHLGRLDAVKDPLTSVRAFARLPGRPHLLMAYTDAPLHDAVEAELRASGAASRARLLGRVDPTGVAELLSASDAFVQASVREVCGVSTLEAAACGALPALSDLPVFARTLGGHGARFAVGDADGAAEAIVSVLRAPAGAREALRAHFAENLSFDALAREIEAVWGSVVERR